MPTNNHNHSSYSKENIDFIDFKSNLRKRVFQDKNISIKQQYKEELSKITTEKKIKINSPASKLLPKYKNIKKKLNDLHNEPLEGMRADKRPRINQEIDLSNYIKTADDELHLLFTEIDPSGKLSMIYYALNNQLKCLSQCERWQMDGTFKSATLLFYQLYIIFGWFNGEMFPLVYCFFDVLFGFLISKLVC